MKWEEIKLSFKNQWVLVQAIEVDENFNLIEGEVIAHSKSKAKLY